ncbi:hypothetical protein HanRHA438_Chr04g0189571 [Helianthus annuus]|uniref:Uncharacterized protein n=1 Tax=Helianthus annuus TaxID=4232 RepID=A0A9K3JAB8_HELAN|nr:hypothetical protein HanXRQr2_Chr04g0179911 [Helianthus annuus]KAJ0928033.1 hypothetical protein HanRHA438_Chr04g0189571 [Helianthus annuus]KAJ0932411.1 hypothetical protein HanPSC8_Chr04g0173351 [Helianthus annuus]
MSIPDPNMEEKKPHFPFFFKRLHGKTRKGLWKRFGTPGLRWKTKFNIRQWFVDRVLFKILSVFEAVVMVSTLCFFYLFCGCHI